MLERKYRRKAGRTASGLIDRDLGNPDLQEAVGCGLVRYCPICDGFEASDLRIGVLGGAHDAAFGVPRLTCWPSAGRTRK